MCVQTQLVFTNNELRVSDAHFHCCLGMHGENAEKKLLKKIEAVEAALCLPDTFSMHVGFTLLYCM